MSRKLSKKQISYRLSLKYAQKYIEDFCKEKQNPDLVSYSKKWDEFGRLKGWMIRLKYEGIDSALEITIDLTPYYGRIIGEIDKIPKYVQGKHQYWDYDKQKKKRNTGIKLYESVLDYE